MSHSEPRLTHTVVFTRLLTGAVFAILGWSKLASLDLARVPFAEMLGRALDGGAAGWYAGILRAMVGPHPGKLAALVGFIELSIGIGLLLGLAVRPMCALGVLYMFNLMLATWNTLDPAEPAWRFLQLQAGHLFPLLVFVLLGVAHAGEHWGMGAVYHRRRIRRQERARASWQNEETIPPEPAEAEDIAVPQEHEPQLR